MSLKDSNEINLPELLAALRRRFLLLVFIPLMAGLVAAGMSLFLLTPVYEASTSLWVVKTDGAALDLTTLQFNRHLTKTYGEVAKSRTVADQVIQRLGLQENASQLQRRVTIVPVRDTEIISISVEDTDPVRAVAIADTLAAVFSEEIHKFIRLDNVRVVDPAVVPANPIRPRPVLNVALAIALGVMIAIVLAFVMEMIDVRIRTPEDVERHLNLPTIGIIPLLQPAPDEDVETQEHRRKLPHPVTGGQR